MAEPSALPAPSARPIRLIGRSDARLVRLAAAGDERAFAAIYERYHQELYRYCRAILGDAQDAQDALQSTMANALRALPGESRAIEVRPWLYRVAHNESISLLRRREPIAEDHEWLLPPGPAADAQFEARERLRTLVADLRALPERQRAALVMRELSGLTPGEIAEALGISPGAARQVVYEARSALQDLEEGRAMECDDVRRLISERDGRILRGRKVRAHLRSCGWCSGFRAAIATRGSDLELVAPPLSAVAASGVLASLIGGSGSGAGALGGLAAGGVSGGAAAGAKVLGVVAASAAIGVGAGSMGADLPLVGGGTDGKPASRTPASEPRDGPPAAPGDAAGTDGAGAGQNGGQAQGGNGKPGADSHPGKGNANSNGHSQSQAQAPAGSQGSALGQGEGIPEHATGNAVGQGSGNGNAYGQAKQEAGSNGPPAVPPGKSETKVTGPPEHSNAGGSKIKPDKVAK